MTSLVVFGGSGSLGQFLLDDCVDSDVFDNIILVVRSFRSYNRLAVKYGDISKFKVLSWSDFLGVESFGAGPVFLNLAYVADGLPWERPFKQRIYSQELCFLARKFGASKFVEISSQAVFGYSLSNDVFVNSVKPKVLPEYGLTKSVAEDVVVENLSFSDIDYYILRLGAVFHQSSAPFFQRLFKIYTSKSFNQLDASGFCNGALLDNVLSGIQYVLNPKFHSKEKVYHFSEIGSLLWSDIFEALASSLPRSRVIDDRIDVHSSDLMTSLKRFTRTNIFYVFLYFVKGTGLPVWLNRFIMWFVKRRAINVYGNQFFIDKETREIFREKYRFVNRYPDGFRYVVMPAHAAHFISGMFQKFK